KDFLIGIFLLQGNALLLAPPRGLLMCKKFIFDVCPLLRASKYKIKFCLLVVPLGVREVLEKIFCCPAIKIFPKQKIPSLAKLGIFF
ncbi:hypothetical protein ACLSZP_10730, partial [Avibacterium avium]